MPGWKGLIRVSEKKGSKNDSIVDPPECRLKEVTLLFFKPGFTAFGGPVAPIAMFRDEVVKRRKWVDDQQRCRRWPPRRSACPLIKPDNGEIVEFLCVEYEIL
jgi:hypothetical protein